MCNLFEGNEEWKEGRKDMVHRKFDMFNHIHGETVTAKIARFNGLVNQPRKLGAYLSDEVLVKKLYDSLPSSWSIQCMTIKRLHDLKRIIFDEFVGIVESYELDAKKREITASGLAENWVASALFSSPCSGMVSSGGGSVNLGNASMVDLHVVLQTVLVVLQVVQIPLVLQGKKRKLMFQRK
jgi:hypothetical protein